MDLNPPCHDMAQWYHWCLEQMAILQHPPPHSKKATIYMRNWLQWKPLETSHRRQVGALRKYFDAGADAVSKDELQRDKA